MMNYISDEEFFEDEYFTEDRLEKMNPSTAYINISLNPQISLSKLRSLSKNLNPDVKASVIDNRNVTPELLEEIFTANTTNVRIIDKIVAHKLTPPQVLAAAASNESTYIRRSVASMIRTPEEALIQLTRDRDSMTASDAVGTLHHCHEPYKTWPEDWVYEHFGVTKHVLDDSW